MPNPQAIVDKTADAYFNQGVLGATVVVRQVARGAVAAIGQPAAKR